MKSAKHLAAAMLAAAMLAGCVSSTETAQTKSTPADDGYAPERSVAEVKAMIRANRGDTPFLDSGPRSNVRAADLHALLADRVVVGYWTSSGFQGGKRAQELFVAVHRSDGRIVSCIKPIREMISRSAWSTRTVPGPDGQVWPMVAVPSRGLWTYLYDSGSGEVAVFRSGRERTHDRRKDRRWVLWVGHVQERLPRAAYKMCPNFPSPERLGLEVNEVQTAHFYDDLLAQDPGRRILRPDLVTPHAEIAAERRNAPQDGLRAIRQRLEGAKGRAFTIDDGSGRRASTAAVYYAPLASIWMLRTRELSKAQGAKVALAGRATWHAGGDGWGEHVRVDWNDGRTDRFAWPLPDMAFDIAGARHPLAVSHDRLLAEALGHEIAGLPAGSRFGADGTVRLPDGRGDGPKWKSHGDSIEIVRSGRSGTTVPLDELVAALAS